MRASASSVSPSISGRHRPKHPHRVQDIIVANNDQNDSDEQDQRDEEPWRSLEPTSALFHGLPELIGPLLVNVACIVEPFAIREA